MQLVLRDEQLVFLLKEFNLTPEDIKSIDEQQWEIIREKSFMIEAEEAPKKGVIMNERCRIAVSIADTKYSNLFRSQDSSQQKI